MIGQRTRAILSWRPIWDHIAPKLGGVYIVRNAEHVLYVGQSQRARNRLRNHGRMLQFMALCANSVEFIPDEGYFTRRALEKELQHAYRPILGTDTDHRGITREWINRSSAVKEGRREPGPTLLKALGKHAVTEYYDLDSPTRNPARLQAGPSA